MLCWLLPHWLCGGNYRLGRHALLGPGHVGARNEDRKGKAGKGRPHINSCQQKLLRDAYAFKLL